MLGISLSSVSPLVKWEQGCGEDYIHALRLYVWTIIIVLLASVNIVYFHDSPRMYR